MFLRQVPMGAVDISLLWRARAPERRRWASLQACTNATLGSPALRQDTLFTRLFDVALAFRYAFRSGEENET